MKRVIYSTFGGYACTTMDNYNSRVMDSRKVLKFNSSNGFTSAMDVIEYMIAYCGATSADEFIVL